MTRFQFVADHRNAFEVKRLCQIVGIARSSFYAWAGAAEGRAARATADQDLADRIRAVTGAVTAVSDLMEKGQAGPVPHLRAARRLIRSWRGCALGSRSWRPASGS